jgi:hypothetical protein
MVESLEATSTRQVEKWLNIIHCLAIDAIEKVNSGHPRLPMGCTPMCHILYDKVIMYNPKKIPIGLTGIIFCWKLYVGERCNMFSYIWRGSTMWRQIAHSNSWWDASWNQLTIDAPTLNYSKFDYLMLLYVFEMIESIFDFFFQAEDGIRDTEVWLEFRRVLFRSDPAQNEAAMREAPPPPIRRKTLPS